MVKRKWARTEFPWWLGHTDSSDFSLASDSLWLESLKGTVFTSSIRKCHTRKEILGSLITEVKSRLICKNANMFPPLGLYQAPIHSYFWCIFCDDILSAVCTQMCPRPHRRAAEVLCKTTRSRHNNRCDGSHAAWFPLNANVFDPLAVGSLDVQFKDLRTFKPQSIFICWCLPLSWHTWNYLKNTST